MSPELMVIVPTRERTKAASELVSAFAETCTSDTTIVFAVDESDPAASAYARLAVGTWGLAVVDFGPSTSMVSALNRAAVRYAELGRAVAFLGDDHRPRTVGWDTRYLDALAEVGTGIVYGNDLLQAENLPTQCAMTSDIVQALGYMAPPVLTHLYVDNFWRDLGRRTSRIRYLGDVVVEHMHPVAGKSEWTPGHQRVNDRGMFERDQQAYQQFVASGKFDEAVRAVEAVAS